MTYQDLIIELFNTFKILSTNTIKDNMKINNSTLYYSLRSLEKKGILLVDRSKQFNVYSLVAKYKKFTYTIRVINTNTKKTKNTHVWDCDLEATMEGIAPINATPEQIRDLHREKLFESMLKICSNTYPPILAIPSHLIEIEDMAGFGISGVQIGETTNRYDNINEVELKFTNNIGRVYDKANGLYDSYQTRVDEY